MCLACHTAAFAIPQQSQSKTPPPAPHEDRILPKPKGAVSDFLWLSGRWSGNVATNKVDRNLMSAEAGSLAGVAIIHRENRIYSVDLLHFAQTIEGVTIYLRHFSPELQPWEKADPIALKLVSIHEGVSHFEGNFHGRPCRWTLTKTGPDAFSIHSDMYDEKGEQQVMDFSYTRIKQLAPLMKSH
jgi:hypothetical protein